MGTSLRARLERIRSMEKRPNAAALQTDKQEKLSAAGWQQAADGLWERQDKSHGLASFETSAIKLAAFSKNLAGREALPGHLCFFDFETSGLSGGSGNIAFLAAVGSFTDNGDFVVRQLFMEDYPYEAAFLSSLLSLLKKPAAIVTYNGASFDMPLLNVRLAMNKINPGKLPVHIDLLHAARRLFRKTLGDCSLKNLETELLGMFRQNDIPGSEVPAVWFDFLKTGNMAKMENVFRHNALDVMSLGRLFVLIYNAILGKVICTCDEVGLASLQNSLDPLMAENTLKKQLGKDDGRAAMALAKLYSQNNRKKERLALAPYYPENFLGFYARSIHAERLLLDSKASLLYAERALGLLKAETERFGNTKTRSIMLERVRRKIIRLKRF